MSNPSDAGYDLYATEHRYIASTEASLNKNRHCYGEYLKGYVGLIMAASKLGLSVTAVAIDVLAGVG